MGKISQSTDQRTNRHAGAPTHQPAQLPVYRILVAALAALAVLISAVTPALADGVIIPDPPPGPEPVPLRDTWLTIRYHRVTVTIEDQVAVTRVEQEFRSNPHLRARHEELIIRKKEDWRDRESSRQLVG